MNILEINLNNPICEKEIQQLKTKLKNSAEYDFLIIDTGEHEFESIRVIKLMREELEILQDDLLKFKKIAFVTPPQFGNVNNSSRILEYFISKSEAKKWFLKR